MAGMDSLFHAPSPGEIWQGGGSTVMVFDIWEEDARVYFLTGRNGLLRTPTKRAFVPLKHFQDGTMRPFDAERDDAWTRAINERYGYSPPTSQDDPRVCGRCRRAWGSVLVPPRAGHFSVFNWRTNKWHSSRHDGETDCGQDATGGEWLWPM